MRGIKFRAWDDHHKVMIDPYCELRDGNFWGEDCTNTGISVKHEHVMQSTGLLDKNGKEIYEHDIITFGNNRNYKVVFEDGAFILLHHGRLKQSDHDGLKDVDGTPLRWGLLSRAHELNFTIEVIGNIHETPELLQQ